MLNVRGEVVKIKTVGFSANGKKRKFFMKQENRFPGSLNSMISAVMYVVIGILFCTLRSGMLNIVMSLIGALLMVMGVINILINKNNIAGILNIAIGLLVILGGWLFIKAALIIFGVMIILKGLMNLLNSLKFKTVLGVLSAVITMVVGILVIFSNWLDVLFLVLGVILIINGILTLVSSAIKK